MKASDQLEYQGITYTVISDYTSVKVVKDTNGKIFLLAPIRKLLIETKGKEGFTRGSGYLYLYGVAFRITAEEEPEKNNLVQRCTVTTLYQKDKTFYFFLSPDGKDILEISCPQFG